MKGSIKQMLVAGLAGQCGFIETPLFYMLKRRHSSGILSEAIQNQCLCKSKNGYWEINLDRIASERHMTADDMRVVLEECSKYLRLKQVGTRIEFRAKVNIKLLLSDLCKFILKEIQ